MNITPSFKLLKKFQTTQDKKAIESFRDDNDDYEQPLSPMSRLMHEPGLNVYIIAIFGTKTPVDLDVFKAIFAHAIRRNHRFSSLAVRNNENESMTWIPTHVNLDNHFIMPELDPNMKSPDTFVQDYISKLSRSHIEISKPLWDVHILNTKTSDAQTTCVFRFHHSIGDGTSLINLLLASSRKVSDPEALPTLHGNKLSSPRIRATNFRSQFIVLWDSLVAVVMFILTGMFLKDTQTPLKRSSHTEDTSRRFVHKSVSLDDIKIVKNAMDVTVNDVLAGVLEAGLYRYLNRRYGENNNSVPKKIRLRALLPVNIRASTMVDETTHTTTGSRARGNNVGFVLLPLSMRHREDPLDYVREIHTIMERKKASFEPFLTAFIAYLAIKMFGIKIAGKLHSRICSNTTLSFSNLPGPQEEISFFGHELAYLAPTCYGQPTELLLLVFSYVDKMTFVVSADEKSIPDPEKLCDDLLYSLHLMKTSILSRGFAKN